MAKRLRQEQDSACHEVARIEQLKLLVRKGLYRPDADTLARAMLEHVKKGSVHPAARPSVWPADR